MDCQTEKSNPILYCPCCGEPIFWDSYMYYDEFYGTVCEKCNKELEDDV